MVTWRIASRIVEKIISENQEQQWQLKMKHCLLHIILSEFITCCQKAIVRQSDILNSLQGLKEKRKEYDERYANTLYNLGVAYNGMGDFISQEQYSANSLEIEKKLYGESSPLSDQNLFQSYKCQHWIAGI